MNKWKYEIMKDDETDGYIVVEKYDNGCYGKLNQSDWWGESRKEIIDMLEVILEDLKRGME